MTDKVLCPWCGGKAIIKTGVRYPRPECNPKTTYSPVCQRMACIIGFVDEWYYLTKEEAVEAWNRRVGE